MSHSQLLQEGRTLGFVSISSILKMELANECQILGKDNTSKFSSMSHGVSTVMRVTVAVP